VYTLDTNAIIYYLKGEEAAVNVLQPILDEDAPIYVSTITELELFSYAGLTAELLSHKFRPSGARIL
jgi:predicted nucleic acid-binding protein